MYQDAAELGLGVEQEAGVVGAKIEMFNVLNITSVQPSMPTFSVKGRTRWCTLTWKNLIIATSASASQVSSTGRVCFTLDVRLDGAVGDMSLCTLLGFQQLNGHERHVLGDWRLAAKIF